MKSALKLAVAFSALIAAGTIFYTSLDAPKLRAAPGGSGTAFFSGELAEDHRALQPFTELHLPGSGKVLLRIGAEPSVTVRTGRNALERVSTTVTGERLVLSVSGSAPSVEYEVSAPSLERIQIFGSGEVQVLDELSGSDLTVDIAGSGSAELAVAVEKLTIGILGSGNVSVRGSAGTFTLRGLGSGDLKAENLNGTEASITVLGSGDTDLGTFRNLQVLIAGSGDLSYAGNPQISAKTPGSGQIRRR